MSYKRKCIICGDKFNLSRAEINLINEGIIDTLDINICERCADIEAEKYALLYDDSVMYSNQEAEA
jgi:hypothetical protein